MSAQRRSSSPLSSASPSPLQAPTGADETAPLTALNLGASAAAQAADEEGNIIGGSSPTTLTEPLTESELTEDEDDMDEDHKVDAPPPEAPADEADEPLSDIGDEDGGDEADVKPKATANNRRSPEGSPLSPSPSLTPPPPSDPPHSQALPSSPHAPIDGAEDITVAKPNGDVSLLADDDAEEAKGIVAKAAEQMDADSGDEALTPEPLEDEDGDVTMRAEDNIGGDGTADNEDATEPNGSPVKHDGGDGGIEVDEREDNPDAEVQVEVMPPEEDEAEEEGGAEAEAEEEVDETDAQDAAAAQSRGGHHSSHAPLPTAAAMRALFALEVKFAALRDRLYVERLEEAAREEEMVLNGTHPALVQLNKTLQSRRERLHEVASRRHHETINDLGNWRKIEEKISWSTWTDQRDQLHWEEFEHTWSKRRRLAREKNELETPKTHRPVPRVDKPPKPFDWSAGAVPPRLSTEDALSDLRAMNTRRTQQPPPQQPQHPARNQSPMYGGAAYTGPSTSMYPYQTAQHPASYLQADNSQIDRRHQEMQAAQQRPPQLQQQQQQQQQQPQHQHQHQAHRQPVASQHAAPSHAHPPEAHNQGSRMAASSVPGPARPPAPQRKVETYAMPPRRELPAQPNGDGRLNGHAAHRQVPRPLAAAAASSTAHPAASNASDSKPALAASTASPSGQAAAQQQADRPQHRLPGFTDYLSRESAAGHPPNSFQHHLNPSTAKPSSGPAPAQNSTASAAGASLVRQAFAQPAPQVQQTAGAQRS